MLEICNLPDIVFVRPGGRDERLVLSQCSARIRAVADRIGRDAKVGAIVGLMFQSEPDLVINWFACLLAGVKPLIMQYPTKKQSHDYWASSVGNTIEAAGVAVIVADRHSVMLGLKSICATISQEELDTLSAHDDTPAAIEDFTILQLSSGTTGYRKGVEFTFEALRRHIADYNETLQLTRSDRVVSWLPLYHDMGYIACFVMPLFLGVEIIMMDPIAWVREPALLGNAIARHNGTVCYMPNFGFELMARQAMRHQPSMRWWISCSEPISRDTTMKFLEATDTGEDRFGACYAMAENVFAVTLKQGVHTRNINGVDVMSCGKPIAHVNLRIVDGEIRVRSRSSLVAYIGGNDICDEDGFYPTGDLGEIIDGELFVTGRKQDLIIQAGQKYMLSDIDLLLNQRLPEVKGRAAAVELFDERLGTNTAVVLVESPEFFLRDDEAQLAAELRDATGLNQLEVRYVPPRFLTKTSSGKFNRRISAKHWQLVRSHREVSHNLDPLSELRGTFTTVPRNIPVEQALDSLSLTILRVILEQTPLALDGSMSLGEIEAGLIASMRLKTDPVVEGYKIVSLADSNLFDNITGEHLAILSAAVGAPVMIEHVCLPPSPIVLSDLVFQEYFLPRLDGEPFSEVDRTLNKLRNASLILSDDAAEMYITPTQTYGVLSHQLQRDPRADLVGVRWQRYPSRHHELPLTVVSGADLPLENSSASLEHLSKYLRLPVFRIAAIPEFAGFTEGWEYRCFTGKPGPRGRGVEVNLTSLFEKLSEWMVAHKDSLQRVKLDQRRPIMVSDLHHYCSHYASRDLLDEVLGLYDRYCIVGKASSVSYIEKVLRQADKSYIRLPSYAPNVVRPHQHEFDCMLVCGPQGRFSIEGPVFSVIPTSNSWTTLNVTDRRYAHLKLWLENPNLPQSGDDWFYMQQMERLKNSAEFWRARRAAVAANRHGDETDAQEAKHNLILLFNRRPWRRPHGGRQ